MKTMRAPKMDVVRFTESDVIVASSIRSGVFGFNNETAGDAYITYNNIRYTDAESLRTVLEADGYRAEYKLYVPNHATRSYIDAADMFTVDIAYEENYETSILIPDGDYIWDGRGFVHYQ